MTWQQLLGTGFVTAIVVVLGRELSLWFHRHREQTRSDRTKAFQLSNKLMAYSRQLSAAIDVADLRTQVDAHFDSTTGEEYPVFPETLEIDLISVANEIEYLDFSLLCELSEIHFLKEEEKQYIRINSIVAWDHWDIHGSEMARMRDLCERTEILAKKIRRQYHLPEFLDPIVGEEVKGK